MKAYAGLALAVLAAGTAAAVRAAGPAAAPLRRVVDAPTPTLERLEMHVTTLRPGETSHAPHKHPEEELIVVKEGTVLSLVGGQEHRLGPGSVILQASNGLHSIRNVGDAPATYHVILWRSAATPPKE